MLTICIHRKRCTPSFLQAARLTQLKGLDPSAFGQWRGDVSTWSTEAEDVFVQYFRPKPRLIIFGAGEDAQPLAAMSSLVGFSVTVADWRSSHCTKINFPDADLLLIGSPKEIVQCAKVRNDDFVVIMTHQFERDQEILRMIVERKPSYLGILGSQRRTLRLLSGQSIPEWVHSPVGLKIGAEGPYEIAISIVAELIRELRKPATMGVGMS